MCSFRSTRAGGESDMRFVYCACAVSYLLNDWRGINKDATTQYIINSMVWYYDTWMRLPISHYNKITFVLMCRIMTIVLGKARDWSPMVCMDRKYISAYCTEYICDIFLIEYNMYQTTRRLYVLCHCIAMAYGKTRYCAVGNTGACLLNS